MTAATFFENLADWVPTQHDRTCSNCEGKRELTTSIWEEFRSLPHEEQIHLMDSKKGEPDRLFHWFAIRDEIQVLSIPEQLYSLPPERIPCQQCGGTGLYPPDNAVKN
ncbi:hypothetical protein [Rufibacter soli]